MAYPTSLGHLLMRAALLGVAVVAGEALCLFVTPGCVNGTTPVCDGSPEAAAACSPILDGAVFDGGLDASADAKKPRSDAMSATSDASDATGPTPDAPTSDAPFTVDAPVDALPSTDGATDASDAQPPSDGATDAADAAAQG